MHTIIKIQNFIYNVIIQKRKKKRNKILYLITMIRCINCYNDYNRIKNSISLIKSNYIIYKIRVNIIQKKKSIILIQKWWRYYLKMKNNFLIRYNKLENELIIQQKNNIEKEKKIIILELLNNELIEKNKMLEELIENKKIKKNKKATNDYDIIEVDEFSDIEYENIDINEKIDENGIKNNNNNDNVCKFKLIINNLYKDIEHYKEDINSRITEKLNLVNQLELINRENRDLLRHVDHLKNKNWFYMFFNN